MLQSNMITVFNDKDYQYDAEVTAQHQMDQLQRDVETIKRVDLIRTERVSDHKFATTFIIDFEGFTPDDLNWEIESKNVRYIQYKLGVM